MLSGATPSALAIVGTAVFKIVVSSASMKKATATSHGSNRLADPAGGAVDVATALIWAGSIRVSNATSRLRGRPYRTNDPRFGCGRFRLSSRYRA